MFVYLLKDFWGYPGFGVQEYLPTYQLVQFSYCVFKTIAKVIIGYFLRGLIDLWYFEVPLPIDFSDCCKLCCCYRLKDFISLLVRQPSDFSRCREQGQGQLWEEEGIYSNDSPNLSLVAFLASLFLHFLPLKPLINSNVLIHSNVLADESQLCHGRGGILSLDLSHDLFSWSVWIKTSTSHRPRVSVEGRPSRWRSGTALTVRLTPWIPPNLHQRFRLS